MCHRLCFKVLTLDLKAMHLLIGNLHKAIAFFEIFFLSVDIEIN